MTNVTYVVAEPKIAEMYIDQNGNAWDTRDKAIESNFRSDVITQVNDTLIATPSLRKITGKEAYSILTKFIAQNPDMVRVMLGDRDKT